VTASFIAEVLQNPCEGGWRNVQLGKHTNGGIHLSDVAGRHDLETTNGKIEVTRCAGTVDAATTNGSIQAELMQVAKGQPMRFETTNGRTEVSVPSNFAADVDAATTNGSIKTDLPQHRRQFPARHDQRRRDPAPAADHERRDRDKDSRQVVALQLRLFEARRVSTIAGTRRNRNRSTGATGVKFINAVRMAARMRSEGTRRAVAVFRPSVERVTPSHVRKTPGLVRTTRSDGRITPGLVRKTRSKEGITPSLVGNARSNERIARSYDWIDQ
jgi:hypothetical protein